MRTQLLGLSVPLLLFAAAFATVIPEASAQTDEAYTISGRVESDSGDPLEGVRVSAYTYPDGDDGGAASSSLYRGADAVTDEDGEYTLELGAGRGFINVYYEEWRLGDGRELVVTGDDDDVDFTLRAPPPKNAIIQGTVVDSNGNPVEGAQVTLGYSCCYVMDTPAVADIDPPSDETSAGGGSDGSGGVSKDYASSPRIMPPYHDDGAMATTGEDGEFTFKAYGGQRQITAWAKGFAQTTMQVTAIENETVQIEVELEKVPASDAILEGRVVDRATGLPIANAMVSARSLEWGRYSEAQTGKDGTYRLQIVPGWTEVTVNVWSHAQPEPLAVEEDLSRPMVLGSPQYYPMSFLIDLERGENDREVKIEAKPKPTIALVGYVVDPEAQKGVEGAHVNVWNHETGDWGEAVTDKTGSFRILVREGHYSASAWKEGYLGGTQTFVVTGESAQRLDLVLPKGTQKWAPCYDEDDCGGPIMYETAARGASDGSMGAPPPMPMDAPTTSGYSTKDGDAAMGMEEASTTGANDDRTGTASFPGEGGGLPEYDPSASNEVGSSEARTGPSKIPGLGVLALVGAAAALALAMRRR